MNPNLFILVLLSYQSIVVSDIQYPKPGVLKYAVFLNVRGTRFCSGTIVSESWVLTAANCVHDRKEDSAVEVVAGEVNYNDVPVDAQRRKIVEVIIHPNFKAEGLAKYDLALIKLAKPFHFTSTVDKVQISGEGWPQEGETSRNCISSGFGGLNLKDADSNTKLKMWNSKALHGKNACPCAKRFQWTRLVCLERVEGVSLCGMGDMGSALVCYNGTNPLTDDDGSGYAKLLLYGIAHLIIDKGVCKSLYDLAFGVDRTACGKLSTVSTYMYLCPYLDWIAKYVPDVPPTPQSCKGTTIQICGFALLSFVLLHLL